MLRVPSDCLCSTYQLFFDRRLREDYDLAAVFPYSTTDILLFKRRGEPTEVVTHDLTSYSERSADGPVRSFERVQLIGQNEREKLLAEVRQTRDPDAMRRWIGTWRSGFGLGASTQAEQGTVTFELPIPKEASLAFGIGVTASQESGASGGDKARARILVSDDQRTETLFERGFGRETVMAGWEDLRCDLGPFAGRRVRLSFKIENHGIPVHLRFSEPRIVTSNPRN